MIEYINTEEDSKVKVILYKDREKNLKLIRSTIRQGMPTLIIVANQKTINDWSSWFVRPNDEVRFIKEGELDKCRGFIPKHIIIDRLELFDNIKGLMDLIKFLSKFVDQTIITTRTDGLSILFRKMFEMATENKVGLLFW